MNSKWVSFSPHVLSKNSTTRTYVTMIILLCPIIASAVATFNFLPLATVAVCMVTAFLTDMLFKYIVDKKFDFTEISSLFIGLVIGLTMPTGASPYVPILGTIFSIVFIRNIAGGIGKNFVSEIAVATLLSYLVFTADFYLFQTAKGDVSVSFLDKVIAKEVADIDFMSLLFGGFAGTIAEGAILWLIIAGVILMVKKVVDFRVPVATIVSTFVFAILFFDVTSAVNLLFAGGVILVSFFVATDYAVVPRIKWAKYVYGLVIGFVTVIIWKYGNNPLMAVYYAVIVAGLLSSMLNGITKRLKNRGV